VLGLLGIFLVQSGWNKLGSLRAGNTMALTGDCPACTSSVYAFVPATKPEVRHGSECHVCGRGLVFQADVARNDQSPWRRVATGRIYLVSRTDDYYDDGGDGGAAAVAAAGAETGIETGTGLGTGTGTAPPPWPPPPSKLPPKL
jgi:hypothetical protein